MEKNNVTTYDFISEGDSSAYFQLPEVGLMNRDSPDYGGWVDHPTAAAFITV